MLALAGAVQTQDQYDLLAAGAMRFCAANQLHGLQYYLCDRWFNRPERWTLYLRLQLGCLHDTTNAVEGSNSVLKSHILNRKLVGTLSEVIQRLLNHLKSQRVTWELRIRDRPVLLEWTPIFSGSTPAPDDACPPLRCLQTDAHAASNADTAPIGD